MKHYYYGSANYIELEDEDDEKIIEKPVELVDKLLVPGDFVNKNVISADTRRFYYSFAYVDKNTLLVQGNQTGFWDIRVEKLEVFKDVKMKYINRHLSFL